MKKLLVVITLLFATLSYAQNKKADGKMKATATAHQVNLSWQASTSPCSGAFGYYVYRGGTANGESTTALNSAIVQGTAFVDSSVLPLTPYFYYAKTSCSTASPSLSGQSNEVTTTTPGDPQPVAPVMNPATSQ